MKIADLLRFERDGQMWVCGASDHSSFCRLCEPLDAAMQACLDNVAAGHMEMMWSGDGLRFRVTEEGKARLDDLLSSDDSQGGDE